MDIKTCMNLIIKKNRKNNLHNNLKFIRRRNYHVNDEKLAHIISNNVPYLCTLTILLTQICTKNVFQKRLKKRRRKYISTELISH